MATEGSPLDCRQRFKAFSSTFYVYFHLPQLIFAQTGGIYEWTKKWHFFPVCSETNFWRWFYQIISELIISIISRCNSHIFCSYHISLWKLHIIFSHYQWYYVSSQVRDDNLAGKISKIIANGFWQIDLKSRIPELCCFDKNIHILIQSILQQFWVLFKNFTLVLTVKSSLSAIFKGTASSLQWCCWARAIKTAIWR